MFGDYASRLLRTTWSKFGERGIDLLAEELSTMHRSNTPLTQRSTLEVTPNEEALATDATKPALTVTSPAPTTAPAIAATGNVEVTGNGEITGSLTVGSLTVGGGGLSGAVRKATATGNWADAAVPTVAATDDVSGNVLSIKLPRTRSGDPNVRTGALIIYGLDPAGDAWCLSDYMDDKIGTIKMWTGAAVDVPAGWQIADGTNGTLNMEGRLPAGQGGTIAGAVGDTAGTADHTHTNDNATTGVTTSSSGSHSHTAGSNTTGLTVDDAGGTHTHTTVGAATGITADSIGDHTHTMGTVGISYEPGGTNQTVATDALTGSDGGHSINIIDPEHSHTVSGDGTHDHTVTDPGHTHTTDSSGGHTHSITDAGHTHTMDTVAHIPPVMLLHFIQRVS